MRWRESTCVHCAGYGAVPCTSAVSCHVFFCARGAAGRHGGGRNSPPNPKGVTPAVALTALFFTLPVHSCREGPEHFGSTPLAFRGSRRLWCVKRSTRVSWRWIHDPQPFQRTALDPRPSAFPVDGVGSTTLNLVKISRPINLTGIVGPVLPLEPLEKRDQKLYLQPTCNHPGRRNLYEQLGHEPRSGETARDHQGDT